MSALRREAIIWTNAIVIVIIIVIVIANVIVIVIIIINIIIVTVTITIIIVIIIINVSLRNTIQWDFNENSCTSIQEHAFGNAIWKMAAILSLFLFYSLYGEIFLVYFKMFGVIIWPHLPILLSNAVSSIVPNTYQSLVIRAVESSY